MSRELANPLQSLIAGVARHAPATTGEVEAFRRRADSAGSGTVLLCDCSSSMAERAGSRTKAELLVEALDGLLPDLPGARIVAFASAVRDCSTPADLPAPAGGTALHLGLDAASVHRPARTVVISDGRPDDASTALAAADLLPGRIDVVYVGPDDDLEAIAFMGQLARVGTGRVVRCDLVRDRTARLAPALRSALALPAPRG